MVTKNHWEIVQSGKVVVSSTAQGLWTNACSYFKFCDENPIITKQTLKSGKEAGKQMLSEMPRPYSIKALCLHCGIVEEWLRDIRNSNDKSSEYYIVVSRILYIIYTHVYEHAMTGIFSPVFSSKALNMDKDDVPSGSIKIEIIGELPPLSKSENEILEKLESEIDLNEISKRENL